MAIEIWIGGEATAGRPANDNGDGPPAVRIPDGRPESTYAHRGNLILPLRFARLMDGWRGKSAGEGTAASQRRTPALRRPLEGPGRRVRIKDGRFARAR